MARSSALTVADYLNELPEDRRAVIAQIREVITTNLPPGYLECMNWGVKHRQLKQTACNSRSLNRKQLGTDYYRLID